MRFRATSLRVAALAFAAFSAESVDAAAPVVLGVQGSELASLPPALVAGESVTLRLLLPPGIELASLSPRLFQTAGEIIQIPLRPAITLVSDADDQRLTLAHFTLPRFTRVARVDLDLGHAGSVVLSVYPSRTDEPALAEALAASPLRLAVAGPSAALRGYLRAEKVTFTDLGAITPHQLEKDVLLIAELSSDAWTRLASASRPPRASLIAFVSDPAILPGVYVVPAAGRTKVTLPLLPFLMSDPRARATLHALLLQTLSSSSDPIFP